MTIQICVCLPIEGVDVARRWDAVLEISEPHRDQHMLPFNDIHLAMAYACAGSSSETKTRGFLDSLREFIDGNHCDGEKSVIRTDHK